MVKFNVRRGLFLSHLLVMLVGLGSFIVISKIYSPRQFIVQLERMEHTEFFSVRSVKTYLVKGFEITWNRSTFGAAIAGTSAAGLFSYWLSKRITEPLRKMRQITQKFAAGQFDERMPTSEIPEFHQLSLSFNRMADSITDIEQRRRELIGDMTHELRTPLTVMQGYLEELADGRLEPTPETYYKLAGETRRLERLVNDLQELSKAEAGYLTIDAQPMSLQPLLESLVDRLSEQLPEELSLHFNCSPDLSQVLADRDRTEQILINLLGNAVRYSDEGKICVRAWHDESVVWVEVSDTGIGIAPEDLPHVFDRFWRAERSRCRHSGGTGIGLAITRRLVELQGGRIEVESELNQGSQFRFSIPRVH
ncbi:MAG: HAMP domain-containing histidine kinase [Cyanobacteria bacterium SID2]|nr:HAMP domain-containing histidine kinase [Cyanobacteria bacterium SID2]MBP0003036.1 HAMP domain-containing histidine kinase [Cyanobacteria bacterium SBC]